MGGTVTAAMKIGAGVLIAVALITLVVGIYVSSTEPAKTSKEEFNTLTTELQEQKFVQFDNTTVTGSDVSSAVRRYASQGKDGIFGINIKTGRDTTGTWYYNTISENGDTLTAASTDTKNISDQTSSKYVNNSAMFKAKLVRDSSNVIRGIVFTQN